MSEGWIKLHRKILDNPTLKEWQARSVFIELLLRATHKPHTIDRKGKFVELQPGQLLTSTRLLAQDCKLGHQVMRRILDLFKNRHMIETETNTLGTVITICNWGKYQTGDDQANTAPTQQPTQHQHSTNTHYKNDKNEKKESTDSESSPETYGQLTLTGDDPEPDRFDEWWSCWAIKGTKRDKKTAKSKYAGVVKRKEATQQQLIDGLKAYMVYCHGMGFGPDKIKHPDRWLNAGAWANEHVVTNSGGNRNGKLDTKAIAARLAGKLGMLDRTPDGADGVGSGSEPDRQERPRSSNRANGEGLLEIPDWFDQEGGN